MNKMNNRVVFFFLLVNFIMVGPCLAKQVITEEVRIWAREVISGEKSLETSAAPNTLSVLYFENLTGDSRLDPFQKGLTVMLLTDLSKVKQLTVLERVKLEALRQELKLGVSGLVDQKTAPKLGKLMGTEYLVGGKIDLAKMADQFSIDSLMFNVPHENIDLKTEVQGELLNNFFTMEKELLFAIIAHFNIKLTEKEREGLMEVPTHSLPALMQLFRGVELSDQGKYQQAAQAYETAMQEDPEFGLAQTCFIELQDLAPTDEKVSDTGYGYSETTSETEVTEEEPPDDKIDPPEREIDFDKDGFLVSAGDCNDRDPSIHPGVSDGCDGIDNDCDGQTDEDYAATPTSCGVGACQSAGQLICQNGTIVDTCIAEKPLTSDDGCDGIDNDCDGQTDEDFIVSSTSCGVGACQATGQMLCQNGQEVNTCNPGIPSASDALCDGIDNDCDGQIDEDFLVSGTSCGVGACQSTGQSLCQNGTIIDTCTAETPLTSDDGCDGIDNDCDGQVDEDYVDTPSSCGVGVCQATGSLICQDGSIADTCLPNDHLASEELCNGLDDDCDGQIDEEIHFPAIATVCGLGVCQSMGGFICQNGSVVDTCLPNDHLASEEICNGLDDDCDGLIDEQNCDNYYPELVSGKESLERANSNINNDDNLRAEVESGAYLPGKLAVDDANPWGFTWDGAYQPGIQAIKADENEDGQPDLFLGEGTLEAINSNNFLAYAVQVEEDRLNQRVLELYRDEANTLGNDSLRDMVQQELTNGDVRSRDDLLMQKADAQAGLVTWDIYGDLVRVQQYVLRPDADTENRTVQILNVCLRGETSSLAGLSTLDFTTTLAEGQTLPANLRSLPWSTWLDTQDKTDVSNYSYVVGFVNSEGEEYPLDRMRVKLTNPEGSFLQEERIFTPPLLGLLGFQGIDEETLNLNNIIFYNIKSVTGPSHADALDRIYAVETDDLGFWYSGLIILSDTRDYYPLIYTYFFPLDDTGVPTLKTPVPFKNIWDALRVNEPGAIDIGQGNLEMIFTDETGNDVIADIIYIPMSRMYWKP